jgi:hypothetical protein
MDHSEFGVILRTLDGVFARLPDQRTWTNCPLLVSRKSR